MASSGASDIIYDSFRWWFRGVKYHRNDRKTPSERVKGTSGTTRRWQQKREPCGSLLHVLAESEGFKPPIPIRVYRISSPARSITLPTLRISESHASLLANGRTWGESIENWTFLCVLRLQRYDLFLKYPKDILVFLKKMTTFAHELENVHI